MVLAALSPWLADDDAELSWSAMNEHNNNNKNASATTSGTGTLWPADENGIPTTDSVHATFTPTQIKYQPRAWQRKPATPAAARSQHQSRKIWKRVPLQNIASNVNAAWEKGGRVGDGIMRPVKKIRVARTATIATAVDEDEDDKENAIVGITAKWDREPSPLKTPRRRRPQNWVNVAVTDANAMMDDEQITQASTTSPFSRNSFINGSSDLTYNLDSSSMTPQSLALQSSPSPVVGLEIGRPEGDSHSTAGSGLDPPTVTTAVDSIDLEDAHQISLSLHFPHTANSDQTISALADQALFDLSPPEESRLETVASTPPAVQASQATQHTEHSHPEDQDDTAYLQAFLSRSRSQRDASARLAQASNSALVNAALVNAGPVSSDLPTLASNTSPTEQTASKQITAPLDVPVLPSDTENGDSSQGGLETAEVEPSSPCRRSSRLTRVPRPQKLTTLPNTIALRRLNGTEFVAMHKEARSIATATRANTKRNKGCAMSVRQRLIQLHAEKHDAVNDERPRNGKGVVWSETIARMQGAEGKEVPYEPDQKPEQEIDESTSEQDEQAGTKAELPSNLTPLRRRRKENLGNVTGTPVPKATIELLLSNDSQEPEEQGHQQIEVLQPTPTKKRRTRTKT
ncbi:hypothetical protein DV736_g1840, partial [Chaetothyriales sp. CBS 134916]